MDIDAFRTLLTSEGQRVLGRVDPAEDALRATVRLRREHSAELVAAVLVQGRLRARARAKFGTDADRMYFTPAGLEQSTRGLVARHRAARFAAVDGPVADLCCGIGADMLALAAAGRTVEGVELDPLTAEVAAANADALGLADRARVRTGDATGSGAARGRAAVFCDPARRDDSGRVFDPRNFSPTLKEAVRLARSAPAGALKLAPGLPHEMIPGDVSAEWISVGGEVKEVALWFGALADGVRRRATVFPSERGAPAAEEDGGDPAALTTAAPPRGATITEEPGLGEAPVAGEVGGYLYDPDGAVVRSHLVAELARRLGGALLDPRIAYITGDEPVPTPFARAYQVIEAVPFSLKRLRDALRRHDVGKVTITKRGSAVDVDQLHKYLKLSGGKTAVVALTRIGERPFALLCRTVHAPLPSA
ncbi:THUMP-like domain-containing protein [Allonocardiopsis opalescens]|uniref:THUMP-like domain-containing protein n=1 Tax=Allonocardiopsis opalescens TaxID=1144618 RepID=A0A2T0Q8D1_9ACTN|nr:SAM-dependent methyltransferase [Allonocardiopsis opalescens]PRY00032.1 hypothetical protein CLV72_103642 [Allonocardiopsis opalescens]